MKGEVKMAEKFHNFKFIIKEKDEEESFVDYHKIKVLGKILDDEACLYSLNGDGEYSLYLQDRFFNFNIVNETKNIASFEGDLFFNKIKYTKLQMPDKIKDVILGLDTQDYLLSGSGGYIKFDAQDIFYDRDKKILQIGKISCGNQVYRFLDNAYTQLKGDKITGLLFTEMEF